MQYIGYLAFRFIVFIFSLIPFNALYRLSNGLAWLFFKVVKYRHKVVYSNLRNSFPEKNESEINEIARKFYLNMADILLESIKGFSVKEAEMAKRYVFINPELVQDDKTANGNSIMMAGHYTNWEWGAIILGYYLKQRTVVGFYKPLANRFIEKYTFKKRGKSGTELVDIGRTAWAFDNFKNQPTSYVLVSDQSTYSQNGQWVTFLNQDTICPHGGDKYAHLYNFPVYFIEMMRVKRGYYEVTFEKLVDNPAQLAEGEITRLFMKRLEQTILKKPEDWLWSHKRWKVKREETSKS
jgi:Kdo2-lipid IVA lauroyltransferase/acyltransferase